MKDKATFLNNPPMTIIPGGWRLDDALLYYSAILHQVITVPTGFETDLASVPRPFRAIVPVANAKNRRAAIVHDRLMDREVQKVYGIDQMKADRIFREAMKAENVPGYRRGYMWFMVRAFQTLTGRFK